MVDKPTVLKPLSLPTIDTQNWPTRSYQKNPSLENYLRLREEFPDEPIEIATTGGIDELFILEKELKQFGIPAQLVAGCLDANPVAISKISLIIMGKIFEERKLQSGGQSQLQSRGISINHALIDRIIKMILDAIDTYDESFIHPDFIVLLKERLGGTRDSYSSNLETNENRSMAVALAASHEGRVSIRKLAKRMGVQPSTVSRWFPNNSLWDEVSQYRDMKEFAAKIRRDFGKSENEE